MRSKEEILPCEGGEAAPSLEGFKARLGGALGNLG